MIYIGSEKMFVLGLHNWGSESACLFVNAICKQATVLTALIQYSAGFSSLNYSSH